MFLVLFYPEYCIHVQSSKIIIKYADDAAIVGLIPVRYESAYREETLRLYIGILVLSKQKKVLLEEPGLS